MAISLLSTNTTSTGGALPYTVAYNAGTGANRFLVVACQEGDPTADNVTTATYGGVSMVEIGSIATSNYHWTVFTLANPASGSNNIVVSGSTTSVNIHVIVYQSDSAPIAMGPVVTNSDGGTTAFITTITNMPSSAWAVLVVDANAGMVAGTHFTERTDNGFGSAKTGDSNGTAGPGSYSIELDTAGSQIWKSVMFAITDTPVGLSVILGEPMIGSSVF